MGLLLIVTPSLWKQTVGEGRGVWKAGKVCGLSFDLLHLEDEISVIKKKLEGLF